MTLLSILALSVLGQVHPARAELLLPEALSAEGPTWIGVKILMDEGWHVYWENPGDSGVAPGVDWTLPEGSVVRGPFFQRPKRFVTEFETTFGFEKETVLLYQVDFPEGTEFPVLVSADVQWMVCKEMCLMGSAKLTGQTGGSNQRGGGNSALENWASRLPQTLAQGAVSARKSGEGVELSVRVGGTVLEGVDELDFYPSGEATFGHGRPKAEKGEGGFRLALVKNEYAVELPERVKGVLTGRKTGENGQKVDISVNIDVPVS